MIFFLVDAAGIANVGDITGGMKRSGSVIVNLNSTPVHDLIIPNIENVSIILFNVQSNCNLTGIANMPAWGRYTFHNIGTAILQMPAENVNSTAINRFGNVSTLNPNIPRDYFYNDYLKRIYPI